MITIEASGSAWRRSSAHVWPAMPLPRTTYLRVTKARVHRRTRCSRHPRNRIRSLSGPLLRDAPAEEDLKASGYDFRSEEHTSELQSPCNLVCRLLLEKKNTLRRLP